MYIRQREPAKIVSKEWKLTIVFLRGLNVVSPDGNGRMSRLLSLLLLYKNGYDAGKYVSFEEQINNYKAYYYEALRQSSKGWENNENSYFPFIENFSFYAVYVL